MIFYTCFTPALTADRRTMYPAEVDLQIAVFLLHCQLAPRGAAESECDAAMHGKRM